MLMASASIAIAVFISCDLRRLIRPFAGEESDKSGVIGRIVPNRSAFRKRNHACGRTIWIADVGCIWLDLLCSDH